MIDAPYNFWWIIALPPLMLAAAQPVAEMNGPKRYVVMGEATMGRMSEPVAHGPISHETQPLVAGPVTIPSHVQRAGVTGGYEPDTVVTLPLFATRIAMLYLRCVPNLDKESPVVSPASRRCYFVGDGV